MKIALLTIVLLSGCVVTPDPWVKMGWCELIGRGQTFDFTTMECPKPKEDQP